MGTARDLATIIEGDSRVVMETKIASIMEGGDIMRLALGNEWHKEMPLGEIMAANDRDRLETASMFVSHIVEAVRFARAHPDMFREFVQGNRQEHALAELEAAFA